MGRIGVLCIVGSNFLFFLLVNLLHFQFFVSKLNFQIHAVENFLIQLFNCKGSVPNIIILCEGKRKLIFLNNVQRNQWTIFSQNLLKLCLLNSLREIRDIEDVTFLELIRFHYFRFLYFIQKLQAKEQYQPFKSKWLFKSNPLLTTPMLADQLTEPYQRSQVQLIQKHLVNSSDQLNQTKVNLNKLFIKIRIQGNLNLNIISMQPQINTSFYSSSTNQFPNLLQNDRLLVKMPLLHIVADELQHALQYLTMHSLAHSAKWIGELLMGITTKQEIQASFLIRSFIHNNTNNDQKNPFSCEFNTSSQNPSQVQTVLLLIKNLFELREYKKCVHVLKEYRLNFPDNQSIIFYYYYSIWMNGLIRKQEEIYENQNSNKVRSHPEIQLLDRELKKLHQEKRLNGLNLYLYGLILKQQQRFAEARQVLIESLNKFPYLWSCWIELCGVIESENLNNLIKDLNDHWMKNLFFSSFCLQKYKNDMSIELNYGMLCFFKNSNFIMNQIAHSFYNNQQFDPSLDWFQKLLEIDPYRFENMDTYSNILYIKQNQGELANLALRQFDNNKYNPETCCVIGNYYSLMGEHLKAIVYFRKALKLDRTCLAAWTLMGHQYLEMKNIPGAIEAYRNAVEIDPKDFRAWYGLGQTYQLQNMNHYALYYFSRAVLSRPKDARMWNAMGSCYEKIGKSTQAQKCYERAECSKDRQGIAIHQMAKLYHTMGPQFELKAVDAFQKNLKRKQEQQINDKQTAECLIYLSRYYKKNGNTEKAVEYSRRLFDLQGIEKDEANKLLHQLNMQA